MLRADSMVAVQHFWGERYRWISLGLGSIAISNGTPVAIEVCRGLAVLGRVLQDGEKHAARSAAVIAAHLNAQIAARGICNFVPSAGKTPERTYHYLTTQLHTTVDWSRVSVWQMDEYLGVPSDHALSFASYLSRTLIRPLRIKQFHRIDDCGRALNSAIGKHERLLLDSGGIDLVVHGIGVNGHLGFNEPGSLPTSIGRQVSLARPTLATLRRSWPRDSTAAMPTEGVTLGLGTLLAARRTVVLATSADKRAAVSTLLDGSAPHISSPVSFLKRVHDVDVLITPECIAPSLAPTEATTSPYRPFPARVRTPGSRDVGTQHFGRDGNRSR
jgi:glucosamine-6-phosphate deaminase